MTSIGYLYLIEAFKLNVCELQSRAHLTNESVLEVHRQNDGIDVYYPVGRIKVEDSWQVNLLFALKHEGINLEVLKAFFARVSSTDVAKRHFFAELTDEEVGVLEQIVCPSRANE